ncbi:RNA methyltransferase [Spiribacter halobius]|uniref:tRNA (cytidine/uridine-2'-O-)-methyltransferase TrmJ n=1 Tax=Sediminicurvatus halobius TaxID=2182432 RepID=A0A2U2N4A2_9GAMM|nr:RNA methyltransferase [Spiribacter halobius]PWG64051.1 tRNA (cytosine(32)/uridine(32)-2'-O)-methyltransferase TrmJ [Spiribacter halobius]UEX76894.1 RNA methyltransferase [Spiribacter halobius]
MAALGQCEFVLVGTSHPGNIGAAARAMKTMGLSRLTLVAPDCEPDAQARATAAHADDLLDAAQHHERLADAVAGATLVLGLTARARRDGVPALDPEGAAALALAETGPVAVLFGRERTGLTNAELGHCHRLVHIPANPEYPALNLAAAVQIMAYTLRRAALAEAPAPVAMPAEPPASGRHLEGLFEHLEALVAASGYAEGGNAELLHRRLRNLFNRARPTADEVNLLRGVFKRLQRRLPSDD